ncbi:hypothetical protein BGZ65_011788, partial [Modicella reniformis]
MKALQVINFDDDIAALLSSSRKGWKVVEANNGVYISELAMEALAKHFPTFEKL